MSDKTRIQSNNAKLEVIDKTLGDAANIFQSLPSVENTNATSTDIVIGKTAITKSGITEGQLKFDSYYLGIGPWHSFPIKYTPPLGTSYDNIEIDLSESTISTIHNSMLEGHSLFGIPGTVRASSAPPHKITIFTTEQQRQQDESGNIYCAGDLSALYSNGRVQPISNMPIIKLLHLPRTILSSFITSYNQDVDLVNTNAIVMGRGQLNTNNSNFISSIYYDGTDERVDFVMSFWLDSISGGYCQIRVTYKIPQITGDPDEVFTLTEAAVYWIIESTGEEQILSTVDDYGCLGMPHTSYWYMMSVQEVTQNWFYMCPGIGAYTCSYQDYKGWDVYGGAWQNSVTY